jgi:flagellar motility protein MotE (MotC chaperone)
VRLSLLARTVAVGLVLLALVKSTALMTDLPLGPLGRGIAGLLQEATAASPPKPRGGAAAPSAPQSPRAEQPAEAQPATAEAAPETALGAALRARREALDARERALAMRETVLAAAERRLTGRITELAALQASLEAHERATRERDEAHWRGIARLYETMRPREAAAVLNELDMPILVQVMDRMGERKAAPILSAMQPERVRLLTVELAQLRGSKTAP